MFFSSSFCHHKECCDENSFLEGEWELLSKDERVMRWAYQYAAGNRQVCVTFLISTVGDH